MNETPMTPRLFRIDVDGSGARSGFMVREQFLRPNGPVWIFAKVFKTQEEAEKYVEESFGLLLTRKL